MNSFLRKGTVKTIETLPGLGDVTISVDNCLADPANPLSGNAYLRCGWPMIEAIAAVEHRIGYGGIALGSALDDSQGKLGAAFGPGKALTPEVVAVAEREEGWILGVEG